MSIPGTGPMSDFIDVRIGSRGRDWITRRSLLHGKRRLPFGQICSGSTDRRLAHVRVPAFYAKLAQPASEKGQVFVPCEQFAVLSDIPCEI